MEDVQAGAARLDAVLNDEQMRLDSDERWKQMLDEASSDIPAQVPSAFPRDKSRQSHLSRQISFHHISPAFSQFNLFPSRLLKFHHVPPFCSISESYLPSYLPSLKPCVIALSEPPSLHGCTSTRICLISVA